MITRIVKLTFKAESVPQFLQIFEEMKHQIAGFEGCESLQLLKQRGTDNVYFTYSIWQEEKYLEAYRNSDFFVNIWSKTKTHFSDKAQVWTLETVA